MALKYDKDDVCNIRMAVIGNQIVQQLGLGGDWRMDSIGREVATAKNKAEALRRLTTMEGDIRRAKMFLEKPRVRQ